ncbi:DNA/RNA non-specific endonuclease [Clostridium sp. 1001271B_151109_B4]|uniref:DNA/RNA non-specific endonuclease n=1 Tax=Clostridium sp. 1001271B_151109_B4 TaxID=2787148 RepID=UPI0018A962FC|nr:DNA/RNA non-specific endonuclease [Clostridium sp. 1001271B_151109_B4]
MKKILKFKNSLIMMLGTLLCLSGLISCSITIDLSTDNNGQVIENSNNKNSPTSNTTTTDSSNITINNIPAYSGDDYIILNNNVPNFSDSDLTTTSFEEYAPLDDLGRCGVAYSNIGTDIMPTEKRESISSVKPSGWQSIKYDIVEGKYLYNRSHLIGYQLTAENANDRNLITGTRYFNATLMLPYENMVADYIKETNNHVLYRVTPVFEGNNLVATGVQMEAKSVEDNGEGIEFNVFVYNVQPGITIDYATGNSALSGEEINSTGSSSASNTTSSNNTTSTEETIIRGNSKSKIYHCPGQRDYENMADSDYLVNFNSEEEAIAAGYRKASR